MYGLDERNGVRAEVRIIGGFDGVGAGVGDGDGAGDEEGQQQGHA